MNFRLHAFNSAFKLHMYARACCVLCGLIVCVQDRLALALAQYLGDSAAVGITITYLMCVVSVV